MMDAILSGQEQCYDSHRRFEGVETLEGLFSISLNRQNLLQCSCGHLTSVLRLTREKNNCASIIYTEV